MMYARSIRLAAGAALLAAGLLTGCKSEEDRALERAKQQAAATNTPQQIQYVDANGDTVNTTVTPPVAPGAPPQVNTQITSPPPGTKPARTHPVVHPAGTGYAGTTAVQGNSYQGQNYASGQTYPNGQPYPNGQAYPNGQPGPNGTTTTTTTTTDQQYADNRVPPGTPYNGQPTNQPPANYHLTVPAGTELAIRINQTINVKRAVPGDHFTGEVVEPVTRDGRVVIPRGTPVRGRVDAAHKRGHFKGASVLELRLTSMALNGQEYALDTHDNVHTKKGKGKRTAGWIGGMGGAGALIGGLAGGGVGLAIGAASGAGAGTVIAGTTGNRDIVIPAESIQHFRLADDLVVQAP